MNRDSPSRSPQSWHEHVAQRGQADARFSAGGPSTPSYAPFVEPEFKAKLLLDWQLVKRARFEAADRLQRRNSASLMTLATVALYGGLITVFVLIFKDSLTPHIRNICDWISAVANWLTLTFSLTEQIKDYSGQSRALHECAQKVNNLRKHLQASLISDSRQLIPFVKDYEAIIGECGPNHDELDYEIAQMGGSRPIDGMSAKEMRTRLARLKRWSKSKTYAIYVVMCAAPAIAGILSWLLVPVAVVGAN